MNVFLLKFEHKHGMDITVHRSETGAWFEGINYMRETAIEWGEEHEVDDLSDDELWASWTELSGETEFFSIEEHQVLD